MHSSGRDQLETKLAAGTTLVLDRYVHSGVAYSAAKGLDLQWCKAPDRGLPQPDLVIFLEVPIDGSSARQGFGEERYEQCDFQQKVRKSFARLQGDGAGDGSSWIVSLDAGGKGGADTEHALHLDCGWRREH